MYLRLAFLMVILIAAFAFHASGSTLVIMRVARIVLVAVVLAGMGLLRRRRGGGQGRL
jgi:hypothetical protein